MEKIDIPLTLLSSVPTVEYYSTKKKEYIFEIKPFTKELKITDKVCEMVTKAFIEQEPINLSLSFNYEEYYPFVQAIAEKNAEKGLGVVAIEKKSKEIAAVILNEDLIDIIDAHSIACKKSESFIEKHEIMRAALKPLLEKVKEFYAHTNEQFKKINIKKICTAKKYQNLGLITRLIKYVITEHPLYIFADSFVTASSSASSQIAFAKNGFKSILEEDYENIKITKVDKDKTSEVFVFDKMEDLLTEKNIPNSPVFKVMYYEKKKDYIQSIVKESDYVEQLELNESNAVYHKNNLEYENEKTKYGEAILVNDVKKKDIINLFDQPVIVAEVLTSKKDVWIYARNILDLTNVDIVIPLNELVERLEFNLDVYRVINIVDGYANLKLVKEQCSDKKPEVEIRLEMPTSKLESKLFDDITENFKINKETHLEVVNIMSKQKIVRLINYN